MNRAEDFSPGQTVRFCDSGQTAEVVTVNRNGTVDVRMQAFGLTIVRTVEPHTIDPLSSDLTPERPKARGATSKPEPARKSAQDGILDATPVPTTDDELLGYVDAPSGRVWLFDIGLGPEAARGGVSVAGLPTEGRLEVRGRRLGVGDWRHSWSSVALLVRPGRPVTASEVIGSVPVDCARLAFFDDRALGLWQHEEALDGLADVVFWGGPDADELARAMDAPGIAGEGFGWTDLPVAEAARRADAVHALGDANRWRFACDLRPHSHHFQLLAQIRATETGSGTVLLDGTAACGFNTSWGDGRYPVICDRDGDGDVVSLRVALAPRE
jgi:hypothetical protein